MEDQDGCVLRKLVSHRRVPKINTRGEIQIMATVAVSKSTSGRQPLPSWNRRIVILTRVRMPITCLTIDLYAFEEVPDARCCHPTPEKGDCGEQDTEADHLRFLPYVQRGYLVPSSPLVGERIL
jgi:hypothetical protein